MPQFRGGSLDGKPVSALLLEIRCRYHNFPVKPPQLYPKDVYQRDRKTDDFLWVAEFADEEAFGEWVEAHPNEWW